MFTQLNKSSALVIGAMFLLPACSAVDNLMGTFEKFAELERAINAELSVDSKVSGNWSNGAFTNVNVIIPANEISEKNVDELTSTIQPLVVQMFESEPETLYVTLSVTTSQKSKNRSATGMYCKDHQAHS